jgi:hypothetical protein
MATANVDGIRKRSSVTTVIDNNSPITSTPIQTETANGRKIDMEHPGGSAHPPLLQAGRIIALVLYFMGSCIRYGVLLVLLPSLLILILSMNLTQFVGAPVYFYDKDWYYAWMAITKQHFGLLLVTLQQWWSPTTVRVSGDESVRGQLRQASDGRLECDFPERMVLISNHVVDILAFGEALRQLLMQHSCTPTGSTFGGQRTPRACTAISSSSSKNR